MVSAVETVKNAIAGRELETGVLEALSYDPYAADAQRADLVPLLAQLLAARPDAAALVPETLINVLLRKMPISDVLEATGLSSDSLDNALVRPVLLNQLVLKARAAEEEPLTQELLHRAFELVSDPELDSTSVALIEKLVSSVPSSAVKHLPLAYLYLGDAVLQSRLMELNLRLLEGGVIPPLNYITWDKFAQDDILLAVLQVDYVGNLVDYFITRSAIQPPVQRSLREIAKMYRHDDITANSVENTLAKTCKRVESVFLELDAQFLLVTPDRIALLARLPAHYIVKHHPEIIEELEVSTKTLHALANIARNYEGLQRLHMPQNRLLNMTIPSQLLVAASAMCNPEGADYFENKYGEVLRNAVSAPATEDTRDLKAELELNMRVFGKGWAPAPSVATRPA